MGPDDTIRSPHATLPWQKAAHKAGSTAKPRCASSNPTDAKITLSPPPLAVCFYACGFLTAWIWLEPNLRALALLAKLHCSQTYFGPVLGRQQFA